MFIIGEFEYDVPDQHLKLLDGYGHQLVVTKVIANTFEINDYVKEPGYYQLLCDDYSTELYLEDAYHLKMFIREEGVVYEGKGGENNMYLEEYRDFEAQNKPAYDKWLLKSEEEFLREARRYRSMGEGFLNRYQSTHVNLSPTFLTKERSRILYTWANQLTRYPEAHIYYTGEEEFAVSDSYHDYMQKVNLDIPDLISLPEYQTFVLSYIETEADILRRKGDRRTLVQIKFDLANQLINEIDIKEFVWYEILKDALQYGVNEEIHELMKVYQSLSQDEALNDRINDTYLRWSRLARGAVAPRLSWEQDGQQMSLDQWQGSYVLVGLGASWCAPCVNDFQKFGSLSKMTSPEAIEIFVLSLDDNLDDALEYLAHFNGINTGWVHDGARDKVKEDWIISGLPRYILLDVDGHILDATAPGPGSEPLHDLLRSHDLVSN